MTDEGRGGRGRAGGDGRKSHSGYGRSGGSGKGGFHRGGQGHGGYRGHGSGGGQYGGHGYTHYDDRREDRHGAAGSEHGYRGGGPRRDDRRGYRAHDDERGGDRGHAYRNHDGRRDDGRKPYNRRDHDDRRDGFRRDDRDKRGHGYRDRQDDDRRGGHRNYRHTDDRKPYGHRDHDDRRGGFRRDDHRGGYRGNGRDEQGDGRGGRGHGYRDGGRGHSYGDRRRVEQGGYGREHDRRDDRRHDDRRSDSWQGDRNRRGGQDRRSGGSRGGWQDRRQDRGSERRGRDFQDGPRRNSDGTVSYPSQNPYTDPRPGEPKMPKGLEWSMLSKDDKERLRGLSKEHAENTGLHILAAYALEESDPERALAHAKWVAKQASRVDISRETLALVAYRQGDYKLALREFRTAYRMNGYLDYLPFIADCERGLGHPRKAIEEATSPEGQALRGESKAEMFLVYAGALGDLGLWDQAVETVRKLVRAKGLSGDYRMRAIQAEQNLLEQAGRGDESQRLDEVLARLETEYADADEDGDTGEIIVDNDLEHATATMLEDLEIPLEGLDEPYSYQPVDEPGEDVPSAAEPGIGEAAGQTPDVRGDDQAGAASTGSDGDGVHDAREAAGPKSAAGPKGTQEDKDQAPSVVEPSDGPDSAETVSAPLATAHVHDLADAPADASTVNRSDKSTQSTDPEATDVHADEAGNGASQAVRTETDALESDRAGAGQEPLAATGLIVPPLAFGESADSDKEDDQA
ncbi:tetratricopeptide repeat protein [Bifidobacterium xylocopae]|uniref:tetratricopeptide repeat protein n=1 Tax=Bifidobacterium xylocopae TaxID=2493119 RepID=UPI00191B9A63|nr:tetratricopeptide repeat protein [Bifidobacterium xylocopae]